MIVVGHAGIYSCGICNCSCWTCIEQVVGFAVLVVEFPVLGLAVDDLALNKLWDLKLWLWEFRLLHLQLFGFSEGFLEGFTLVFTEGFSFGFTEEFSLGFSEWVLEGFLLGFLEGFSFSAETSHCWQKLAFYNKSATDRG